MGYTIFNNLLITNLRLMNKVIIVSFIKVNYLMLNEQFLSF